MVGSVRCEESNGKVRSYVNLNALNVPFPDKHAACDATT